MIVATILAGSAAAFLYDGGWFAPEALTPARLIDTFERVNGKSPGFRRNHAKGVGAAGVFESSGAGARLSKSVVFVPGERVPVVGRFALAGGKPYAADAVSTVRSLALQYLLPSGEEWRTAMNALPVFAVRTPEAFRDQLVMTAPDPATGKPDAARVKAFLERYPETARAIARIRAEPPAAGFADSTYRSLDAFFFVDASGRSTPVRWAMVPEPTNRTVDGQPAPNSPNFLFDALAERAHRGPLRWHLLLTVGRPGDPTDDATVEWPPDRETVDAGTLIIDRIESEETSPARLVNFDPLVLPSGIVASDDPLLSARSAAYSVSFRRRAGERVSPSALSSAEVGQ